MRGLFLRKILDVGCDFTHRVIRNLKALQRSFSIKNNVNIKNIICVLPWVHLNILPDGKVLQCCLSSDYGAIAGDLNKQTIEEIWNGDFMKSLRKQMINGVKPAICSSCFEKERLTGTSWRLLNNCGFEWKLKEIPDVTEKDGHVDRVELRFWDFRFSNICNNKCRYCGPHFSSSWIPDAKELGLICKDASDKPTRIESIDKNRNVDFLKKHISIVEQINFVGGEPLLTDEHWQILEMLDERKRYDVNIAYNTNLSTLKYKNKNALDYWRKFGRRIFLMASIDEIDERAELIRSGTDWKTVETNLKAVNEIGIQVSIFITVSAMNVFRIPEILDRMIAIGVIKQENGNWNNFELNILTKPAIFHVSILPDKERKEIRLRLENYINEYEKKYGVKIIDRFWALFWHLEKPWHKKNGLEFKEFTNAIDKIRGENTLVIVPQLKCVLNQ